MGKFCSIDGSCKSTEKVWGVVNKVKNTLHRVTFSKNLADHIVDTVGDEYEVRRFGFELRDKLSKGETSKNGLYALVSALKKDLVLRIGLIKETSEMMSDDDTRYLANISLSPL
ncbi:MAG: hypothetical protein JXR12_05710 [Neptunomonas phycophila]|uniref:hypothetical protein n=1 Tax=Neptunomonas phycophila TaxID=1572645 RepID=UPI003B8DDF59